MSSRLSKSNSSKVRAIISMVLTSTEYVVSHVLGASIILGLHNVYVNTAQFGRVRYKRSPTGMLVTAQLVASVAQLINQLFFSMQLTQPVGSLRGCTIISDVADVFYFTFQLLTSSVLIVRATILVPPRYKVLVQAGLGLTLLAGFVPTVLSSIRKQIFVMDGGFCGAQYNFAYNNIGKIVFFVLYVLMLCAFSIPALRQLRQATHPTPSIKKPTPSVSEPASADGDKPRASNDRRPAPSIAAAAGVAVSALGKGSRSLSQRFTTAATAAAVNQVNGGKSASFAAEHKAPAAPHHMSAIHRYIRALILTMAFRIFVAIFGYLMTVTLSFLGVWPGSLWMVQFTVQNYCAIVASTFAMSSGGNSGGAGAGGNADRRLNRQVASTASAMRGRQGSVAGEQHSRNQPPPQPGFVDARDDAGQRAPLASSSVREVGSDEQLTQGRAPMGTANMSLVSIPSTAMSALHEDTFAGVSQSALSDGGASQGADEDGEESRQADKVQVEIDMDALAQWNREQQRNKSKSMNVDDVK